MRVLDISMTLCAETVSWPGEEGFAQEQTWTETVRTSRLSLGTHTGTHVDAPAHFIPGGVTVDRLPLAALVGSARVLAVTGPAVDEPELRAAGVEPGSIVLFRTQNSWLSQTGEFAEEFCALTPAAADYLAGLLVRAVGVDYLSVEPPGQDYAHRRLLGAGVVIIEGLRLGHVEPGAYLLACLPLKVAGGDGAPARAVLIALP